MENYENGRRRSSSSKVVVLVPCPLEGHLPPMLQLGTLLYSKGFSITIVHTSFKSPDPSIYPYFKFVKLEDGLAGCEASFYGLLTVIPAMNKNCMEPLHKLLVDEEEEDGTGGVCCIIYDPVMYYTDAVAKESKIPSLIFRTSSAAYLQALRVNLKLLAQQDGVLPESQLLDLVPVLDHLRFKDLPIPLHFRLPEVVLELEAEMSSIKSSPFAIILNSTNDLENPVITQLEKDLKIPVFPLGPLHKMISNSTNQTQTEEDRICMEWLNKQAPNSVVYVSFGSIAILEEKDVVEIAWGLANSEQPFLWVVRPGSIQGSKWTENLPQDFLEKYNKQEGLIVKWAPQKEVLAHSAIGVFWSHCGWNSTLESICEGIPMICRPSFADQNVNARYLAHVWKVAIEMESPLQRETVEKAIRHVIDEDEGEELKINVLKLKKKVEANCVKEDGNSCKFLDKLVEFIHALPREQI